MPELLFGNKWTGLITCKSESGQKKVFSLQNTMVCQTAALALHTLAAQAATRRRERSLTHVRPQPCALATPCPPRAHRCTSCSAVCPHWHRAPTEAARAAGRGGGRVCKRTSSQLQLLIGNCFIDLVVIVSKIANASSHRRQSL